MAEQLHTTRKIGKPGKLEFVEQLKNIEVKIFSAPTIKQFRNTISVFMLNTWNDKIKYDGFTDAEIDKCIKELFAGEILPTGMETINICFGVSGLDMIDTTHLIRHRLASFSAQAHGDRDMRDDRVMVKASIMESPFYSEYQHICNLAHTLYMKMMDSELIHGLDARTIMPRCFEHFYLVRFCIKDLIAYCQMRGDEQIQTQVDNIVAMKLWLEVLKIYPFLKGIIDFRKPDAFYVKQCLKGKTNIFPPNKKNLDAIGEQRLSKDQYYHHKNRDEYLGSHVYLDLRNDILNQIDQIENYENF